MFCPHCNATLQISAKNWIYCPNKFRKTPPCPFVGKPNKSNIAGAGISGGEKIPLLTTMSEEQQTIINRAKRWKKK